MDPLGTGFHQLKTVILRSQFFPNGCLLDKPMPELSLIKKEPKGSLLKPLLTVIDCIVCFFY